MRSSRWSRRISSPFPTFLITLLKSCKKEKMKLKTKKIFKPRQNRQSRMIDTLRDHLEALNTTRARASLTTLFIPPSGPEFFLSRNHKHTKLVSDGSSSVWLQYRSRNRSPRWLRFTGEVGWFEDCFSKLNSSTRRGFSH